MKAKHQNVKNLSSMSKVSMKYLKKNQLTVEAPLRALRARDALADLVLQRTKRFQKSTEPKTT